MQEFQLGGRDAEFLGHFAARGGRGRFAGLQVSAHGRVPFAGLDVFGGRPELQQDAPLAVEDLDSGNGMDQRRVAVAFAPQGASDDAVFVRGVEIECFGGIAHVVGPTVAQTGGSVNPAWRRCPLAGLPDCGSVHG